MKYILFPVLLILVSCSSGQRYPDWQYVRIEYQIPSEECEYKVQEACSYKGAACYNWYKKRATKYGANTVVITQADKDINSSSRTVVLNGSGGSSSETNVLLTALADYYSCPAK